MSPAVLGAALVLSSYSVAQATESKTAQDLQLNQPLPELEAAVNGTTVEDPQEVALVETTKPVSAEANLNIGLEEGVKFFAPGDDNALDELTTTAPLKQERPQVAAAIQADVLEELERSVEQSKTEISQPQVEAQVETEAQMPQVEAQVGTEVQLPQVEAPKPVLSNQMVQVPAQVENSVLDQINRYSTENTNGSLGQGVPGAAQFSDVSPSDWAYQALDDLSRRYDCLKGYPNGTFRGSRALSRYEFAAGLNACLQQIERLIAASTADFVTRADLEALQRLVQEFEAELATLGTRVDNLEGRVSFLEDHQFSTTTKLAGEAIMALTTNFSSNDASASSVVGDFGNSLFGDRVRLELNTSFSGRDRLVTRMTAGNLQTFRTGNVSGLAGNSGTFEAIHTFNRGENGNAVDIDWLAYYFPYGNSQAYLSATGGTWSDIAPTLNPYFEDFDGGKGSLSTFAQRNPIYRIGGGSGLALSFGFTPVEALLGPSTLTIGYLAGNAASPNAGAGLVDGDYAMLGQLNANISDAFGLGLTYVHGYHATNSPIFGEGSPRNNQTGLVGTYLANNPSALLTGAATALGPTPTVSNSYGAEIAFRPSSRLSVSGFVTKTNVRLLQRGDGDIWTYGLGIALPDLGKQGNVLGLFGGVQPSLVSLQAAGVNADLVTHDLAWHVEGFYKYQLTDNISITPGVVWITNPNQNATNDSAIIGTLRTTFTF